MAERPQPVDPVEVVARYQTDVYRYAFRLIGSASDAEDLVQQTFLTAIPKLAQVRCPDAMRAWLFTVARSCFLKQQRKRRPVDAVSLGLDFDELACADAADDQPFDSERLQSALVELPENFRIVLMMYYFEELSYQQIANQLELPSGTVMSRLARAKAYLRERLVAAEQAHTNRSGISVAAYLQDAVRRNGNSA